MDDNSFRSGIFNFFLCSRHKPGRFQAGNGDLAGPEPHRDTCRIDGRVASSYDQDSSFEVGDFVGIDFTEKIKERLNMG